MPRFSKHGLFVICGLLSLYFVTLYFLDFSPLLILASLISGGLAFVFASAAVLVGSKIGGRFAARERGKLIGASAIAVGASLTFAIPVLLMAMAFAWEVMRLR